MQMLYVLFLGIAVSFDALLAGVTYGIKKISVPFSSLLVVGGVTTLCTAAAMLAARGAGELIENQTAVIIGAVLLLLIGLWSVFQEYLMKRLVPKGESVNPEFKIRLGRLIISILGGSGNSRFRQVQINQQVGGAISRFGAGA